jgi:transcriptional regulator with XRE-family HTH domain
MAKRLHTPRNVIGAAVQRRRMELGWSQAKLAAQCQLLGWDISRGIVAALEGRVRWAGDYEVAILAKAMRTSITALYPSEIDWSELGYSHISNKGRRPSA